MPQVTSAEANKIIKDLRSQRTELLAVEAGIKSFVVAIEENVEDVRPEYDFATYQKNLEKIDAEIRKYKHALNVFNTTTVVPNTDGMTIDEVLVTLPQLSERLRTLSSMAITQPKSRVRGYGPQPHIEYNIANYDIDAVKDTCNRIKESINNLQLNLDLVNSTVKFNVED